jgi:hypothetical protein
MMIKPGEEILPGAGQRFLVLDVLTSEGEARVWSDCYRSRRRREGSERRLGRSVAWHSPGPVEAGVHVM